MLLDYHQKQQKYTFDASAGTWSVLRDVVQRRQSVDTKYTCKFGPLGHLRELYNLGEDPCRGGVKIPCGA